MADEAPAGMHQIQNVHLETIEAAVYTRDYEKASRLMLASLRQLKTGAEFVGYGTDARVRTMLYTRLCAAMIAMLADPKYTLSQDGFEHFCAEHAIIDLLFRASAFETSDHLMAQIARNVDETDRSKLVPRDGASLVKFLLAFSLRSGFKISLRDVFLKAPQQTFALWAGMMSPLLTTSVQAQQRREDLNGMSDVFADVKLSDAVLPTLSDSYMYTSYCVRPDKHDAKAMIHKLMARMLRDRKAPLPSIQSEQRREIKDRPRMLIPLEWFTSLHAMYRCYAPIIRQLRKRFYLIGMCREFDIDAQGKSEFDEWVEIPHDGVVMVNIIEQVNKLRPDIIYYPSIGMALWWVIMSSVRMAPIQIMGLGHPASSRSPAIDYVMAEEGCFGDPRLFTEKLVVYPTGSARFIMRPDAVIPEPLQDDAPDVVHVAVPAMLCKLNAGFMAALSAIAKTAKVKTHFHFFVNMLGVNLHQSAREIRDWLPDSTMYERMSYVQYMGHLAKCHLHLCTFPFGGTNSNIDSMLCGLPLVSLHGAEPHSRFDAMMIRRAGLPESLITDTAEQYINEAVRLIDDHGARQALRSQLMSTDLEHIFFGEPPPEHRLSFLRAVEHIYENHDRLRHSDVTVINCTHLGAE